MSNRLTIYIMWGFSIGFLLGSFVSVFSGGTDDHSTQSLIVVFAAAIFFAAVGAVLAYYFNRKGRPDAKLEIWEVLGDLFGQNYGLGLTLLITIVMLLILLSKIFQIHVFGF